MNKTFIEFTLPVMGYCAGGAHQVSITLLYKMGENVNFGNIQ